MILGSDVAGTVDAIGADVSDFSVGDEVYGLTNVHFTGGYAEYALAGMPEHLIRHLVTMAELNRAGRYDRMADGVERVTGRKAMSIRDFVSLHADEFGGRRS